MRKIKKICVISWGYPTEKQPWFSFVDQLLCAMSKQDVECTVIAPQSFTKNLRDASCKRPTCWIRKCGDKSIRVFQPYFFSFSNLSVNEIPISSIMFEKAVIRQFFLLKERFDAIYGHFWFCGLIAAKIATKYNLPAYVACGESEINYSSLKRNLKYKDAILGVICASTKSKDESISLRLCTESQTIVCPNSVDLNIFCPDDKVKMRERLGIDPKAFIVIFVGSFTQRKGSRRVDEALNQIKGISSLFVGAGSEEPMGKHILFKGQISHEEIPMYLNASDVFVLPTLNEGCCNAIVEAMACGLPIISSNLSFNDDILDDSNSLRIDPNNIDEISKAISCLKDNFELRSQLSAGAKKRAESFSIDERASRIIAFMEKTKVMSSIKR